MAEVWGVRFAWYFNMLFNHYPPDITAASLMGNADPARFATDNTIGLWQEQTQELNVMR